MKRKQRLMDVCATTYRKGIQTRKVFNISVHLPRNSSSSGSSVIDLPDVQSRRISSSTVFSRPSPSVTVVTQIVTEIEDQLKSRVNVNPDRILSLLKQVNILLIPLHICSYIYTQVLITYNLIVCLCLNVILLQLNDMKLFVPLPLFMDAVGLLAKRNDVMRTELLMLLARENLSKSPFTHHKLKRSATDSLYDFNEKLRLPLDKLVSFAISKFAEESSVDKTMKLWKRLNKFGCKGDQFTVTCAHVNLLFEFIDFYSC